MALRATRARWLLLAIVVLGAAPATADAAPTWLPGDTVSAPGNSAFDPSIAVAPGGEVVALSARFDGADFRIDATSRAPGGSFAIGQPVSAAGASATLDQIVADGAGNFVAVWRRNDGANERIEYADRPAGGPFGAGTRITPDADTSFESNPDVAVNPAGDAFVVFRKSNGANNLATVATRVAGGSFALQTVSAAGQTVRDLAIAAGAAGDAAAVWTRSDGTHDRIQASIRAPGGSFSAGANISGAATDASLAQVAVDSNGNAVAVWQQNSLVQASFRPSGGAFGAPAPISAAGQAAGDAQVAFDSHGNALVVWDRSNGTKTIAQAAFRPAGGAFAPAVDLSAPGQNATLPQLAVNANGDAVVVWKRSDGTKQRIQAAARPAGGSFGASLEISAAGQNADLPEVASDAQGNAAALFVRFDGAQNRATVAGYDAAGPLLNALAIPTSGLVGVPLAFSVNPVDVWSAVASTTWSFGDGSQAAGASASHSYGAVGSFSAMVTAIDALGNASSASGPAAVTSAPAGAVPAGSSPTAAPAPVSRPAGGACAVAKLGTARADTLTGTAAGDAIHGGKGNDRIAGLAGNDCLFGEAGNDVLAGGAGNDRLSGGPGSDKLAGGRGADTLNGGQGKDAVDGGAGNDKINSADHVTETVNCGPGRDVVRADKADQLVGCEKVARVG